MTSNKPTALDIRDLWFHYGSKSVLENIGFSIQPGELLMLLGLNGAGKTTLFSLICGLFSPPKGEIFIDGINARQNPAKVLAKLGVVFQAPTLDLDLSVRQNLQYYCALNGVAAAQGKQRISAELTRLGMVERADEKVRALNGGHRRRVEIARAALKKPSLLLLDEPTVGLDIGTRSTLIKHLHKIPKEDGTALLWATHLLDEVEASDRVLVLHEGKLVANGRPSQIAAESGTKNLRQAFNKLTGAQLEGDVFK